MRTIDYFDKGAEIDPAAIAIVDGEVALSFAEVQTMTRRLARAMVARGMTPQEPVAIYAPNHWGVLVCLLGLWRARAVWVPVNARNAFEANAAYLNYTRAAWLFYHSSYADDAAALKAAVPSLRHLVCLDGPEGANASLDAFMAEGDGIEEADWGDPYGNPSDGVGIFPTGGTTGPSKGVWVTNTGWGTMLETAMKAWETPGTTPVCLATAPLTHAAGPVATAVMAMGGRVVILPGFDAGAVLAAIEAHRVTHMFLPPTALYSLLGHPDLGQHDYSSMRVFLLAGSAVSPDKLKAAVEAFGPCMCQSYGQVESPMIVTWLAPQVVAAAAAGDHPERLASCGRPTGSVRVGIMDDEGTLLPPGEAGEIVVRGALVSQGYYEKPEDTAAIRAFGWHHTGDVGYRDADGFVFIVDRKKDMIVTGGFNVFSAEVEAVVMELPSVRECAVVGAPDDHWGEAVKAVVVLAEGEILNESAVIAHCKARLGGVKAPKSVEAWSELPRTPAGKLDKKAVRAKFWAGKTRLVN